MNGPATLALDWQALPLAGRCLVEASAGTGKTHQIALLYLRLLLERGAGVEQVLVCTFTDAAARELRARIRQRLAQAELLLQSAPAAAPAERELQDWLEQLAAADPERRERLRAQLRAARLDFDRAPISTIHGWCARVLRDQPLAGGALPGGFELLDEAELLAECYDDFRRRCLQAPPAERPPYADLLIEHGRRIGLALAELAGNPEAQQLLPEPDAASRLPRLQAQLRSSAWQEAVLSIRRQSLKELSAFGRRIAELVELLQAGGWPQLRELRNHYKFSAESLQTAKRGPPAPDPARRPEIQLLLGLEATVAGHQRALLGQALHAAWAWCSAELGRRAAARRGLTYGTLIERTLAALRGPAGARLAAALRRAQPHALIDEFQDTDQRQFEIFDRIYASAPADDQAEAGQAEAGQAAAEPGFLAFVGDPKQAIYGFRGGDLAAYARAAASAGPQRWSIAVNWRSAAPAVAALNTLYGATRGGFADPDIRYQVVSCGGGVAQRPCQVDGVPLDAGLWLHLDGQGLDGSVEVQQARVLDACADRIAELLDEGRHRLGTQPLQPGDIAVLLATHQQVAELRQRLVERGVPAASAGRSSVLQAPIAAELELLLHALLQQGDDRALRGALATELLGFDLAALAALDASRSAWDVQLQRFERWRRIWRDRGVLALVEALLEERAAAELERPDGERRLTDLRHLGELLLEQTRASHGLQEVLAALRQLRREEAGTTLAERQLRVETDARRVQLLTLHASKGLQFPFVFLPLLWRPRQRDEAPLLARFHDSGNRLSFDFGSSAFEAHRELAAQEQAAEQLRQLYVALTRAQYATHLFWSERQARGSNPGPLDLLLAEIARHAGHGSGLPREGIAVLQALASDPATGIRIVSGFPPATRYYRDPHSHAAPPRAARSDWPTRRPPFLIHSFSGLTQQLASLPTTAEPAQDEPAGSSLPEAEVSLTDLLDTLPNRDLQLLAGYRGPRFGNAAHAILELAEAAPLWPEQRALVEQSLRTEGFVLDADAGARLVEPLARRLQQVRQADLLEPGFRLARLAPSAQVREFEFHFSVRGIPLARLRNACAQHGQPELIPDRLSSSRLQGLMTGFIDLVAEWRGRYYVLDYKSNWLGDTLAHYRPEALDAAIRQEHYDLQALIYSIALHRYLRQRLPGYSYRKHCGGALYVYLRAFGLAPGSGLHQQRFDPALIETVDRVLAGEPVRPTRAASPAQPASGSADEPGAGP